MSTMLIEFELLYEAKRTDPPTAFGYRSLGFYHDRLKAIDACVEERRGIVAERPDSREPHFTVNATMMCRIGGQFWKPGSGWAFNPIMPDTVDRVPAYRAERSEIGCTVDELLEGAEQ